MARAEARPEQEWTAPGSARRTGADPRWGRGYRMFRGAAFDAPWRRLPRPEGIASGFEWRHGGEFTVGAEDELVLVDDDGHLLGAPAAPVLVGRTPVVNPMVT